MQFPWPGPWRVAKARDVFFALDRQVREEKEGRRFPGIPVLLGGPDLTPSFLFLNTWIDLRRVWMVRLRLNR